MDTEQSRFVGVSWDKNTAMWQAHITINGERRHLGSYTLEAAAARAYDKEAEKYPKVTNVALGLLPRE